MTTELTQMLQTDQKTGLILPLSRLLDSRAFISHKALVGEELEVLARRYRPFGWERDRGTRAHDRLFINWITALQDYPIEESRAAIAVWVRDHPDKMPNEGHIYKLIQKTRRQLSAQHKARSAPKPAQARIVTDEMRRRADEVLVNAGFALRKGSHGLATNNLKRGETASDKQL